MDCILGIDFGTTNIASVLINPDTNSVVEQRSQESEAYLENRNPAIREQDIERIRRKFYLLLEDMLKERNYVVRSIGLTGQMHGILGVDSHGNGVTNFVTWQDQRGLAVYGEDTNLIQEMYRRAGARPIATGYGIVTLFDWVKKGEADKISKICTLPDYFALQLTGKEYPLIDETMADSIGCFEGSSHSWDWRYIKKLGIDESLFPDIVRPACICGTVGDEKLSSLIQNRDVPIGVAIGDNQASFIGSVKDYYHTLLINIGTGSQISFAVESIDDISKTQKIDGYDVVVRPFIEGGYLIAGNALSGGGSYAALYNFFREAGLQLFGISDFENLWEKMENLAEVVQKRRVRHEHLRVTPLFAGKRSNPEERGRIEGINLDNFIPETIIFETLRGIAVVLKDMIDERIIEKRTRIVGSGNGLRKNRVLRNILSDQFKHRVHMPRYREEAAIGAALCGAVAAGIYRNFREANEVIRYL